MDRKRYFEGIEQYRLLAKHEVGQNFLIDDEVAERIVSSLDVKPEDKVIEIGSGAGSLTYFLNETGALVDAIDIDEALVAKLQKEFDGNTRPLYGNGAKWDYAPYTKIIGNLPYYITSSLIERAILKGINASKMVFMVQKEAGERLLSAVGSKDYGPLPILIALLFNTKRAFTVRRDCFVPAPHIDSCVLTFDRKRESEELIEKTYRLSQSLFLQRRKTIFNNLRGMLHDEEKAKNALEKAGIDEKKRPEQVTPEQYFALAQAIYDNKTC